jgi:hypothetical protein
MRIAKACSQCRLGKRKCRLSGNGAPCHPCARRELACSLRATTARPSAVDRADASPVAASVSVEIDQCLDVVRLYLRLIHHKPHTLFHPATLLGQVREGSLPGQVLYGILALTARFSEDPNIRAGAAPFFARAKASLKSGIDRVSLTNIQACVLVGNVYGAEGDHEAESLYFGIAFRMAQILHLPEPTQQDDPVSREVKLRVWWSLYMIDTWSSAGNNIPRQFPDRILHPLPMDEVQFHNLSENSDGGLPDPALRPGLWGRMVLLATIFGHIQNLHQQHLSGVIDHQGAERQTHILAADLDLYVRDLPPSVRMTRENLEHHIGLGVGSAFVALHLGFYHYSTLLYFPFLDLRLEQTPSQVLFAARCRHYAAALSDLLDLSNEIDGCDVVYFIVAHMATVSSSALLHTLMFGDEAEMAQTRKRLETNFAIMIKLRTYWPAVNLLVSHPPLPSAQRQELMAYPCRWTVSSPFRGPVCSLLTQILTRRIGGCSGFC